MRRIKQLLAVGLAALVLVGLQACSQDPADMGAAPLGDRGALEALADAYTEVSNTKLAPSPMSLPADKRKAFVVDVFTTAGYSYALTLKAMAGPQFDKSNQLHRDMADLVLMPHRNQRNPIVPIDRVYTAEELQDVAVVERAFNM